jgi:hypothetical protein
MRSLGSAFFILLIYCAGLNSSGVCIKGCNIFLHSQTPPSLPKVFLLDLLGSHLAKSGLTTRAEKLLTICYADFFLYSIGNGTIRRIFVAKAVAYGNRMEIFCVIILMLLSEKK